MIYVINVSMCKQEYKWMAFCIACLKMLIVTLHSMNSLFQPSTCAAPGEYMLLIYSLQLQAVIDKTGSTCSAHTITQVQNINRLWLSTVEF